jgi:hypothetical protein
MVLDWDEPTGAVKDAFAQFSPDGLAAVVMDFHNAGGKPPKPHLWKRMPVMALNTDACYFKSADEGAGYMSGSISRQTGQIENRQEGITPAYYLFRIVWTSPDKVVAVLDKLKQIRPDLDIEVMDPYNFFRYFKSTCEETVKFK